MQQNITMGKIHSTNSKRYGVIKPSTYTSFIKLSYLAVLSHFTCLKVQIL